MRKAVSFIVWLVVAVVGAAAFMVISFHRGEPLNAVWILTAAICTYAIGYRFYSKWIAAKLLALDDRRATPCEVHEDGHDFVKTNKWIVFGHHFAAISGPGPLVGPVLAAQFGYLPGTLWILIGVVLGGAVQDFMILFCSIRRDGKSLGEMVKDEINAPAGVVALMAIVSILIILIAVLGLIVVQALADSPWGIFTVGMTIPIALFMGCYLRFVRPGRVLEVTAIGVVLLLSSVYFGQFFHSDPVLGKYLKFTGAQLSWAIILYGLAASSLPVWLLLAPRDYLSTFMKLGTIGALAVGIFFVLPKLQLPALTQFVDGSGKVVPGKVFPFCFITIACGAISGFHSLVASGITPKIITRESFARPIGYGCMLLESGVAIMAMIAACTLQPGLYFAINTKPAALGGTVDTAVVEITRWGYPVTVKDMDDLAERIGEDRMFGRVGGAPTLAVGMAQIFSQAFGAGGTLMKLWYHFAIMFEALFILTTVDAGTRVGRFLIQAFLAHIWKPLGNIRSPWANLLSSVLLVSAWGYFMYQGVMDEQGGVKSLWPLFGIANQLLSLVALCFASTVLIKMGKKSLVWVTLLPLLWLTAVTFTAGLEKIFHPSPGIGFLARARQLTAQLASIASSTDQMKIQRDIFNAQLDAWVAGIFLVLVGAVILTSVWRWIGLWTGRSPLDLRETVPVWLSEAVLAAERPQGSRGWLWSWGLLGLGLLKHLSGQSQFERAQIHAACCVQQHDVKPSKPGEVWAKTEEKRFQSPRCC